MKIRKASHYLVDNNDNVICALCAHGCRIAPGATGICGVRYNRDGNLYSLVYGAVVAEHVDPVEKKPLFHLLPGSLSYSLATVGCNFRCLHCQNHHISQVAGSLAGTSAHIPRSPTEIVAAALHQHCNSLSYTYVEPTVFYEFALDCMRIAHENGLKNIFVTNGYMREAPMREMAPWLDGVNIDLKSFRDDFYRTVCGARLAPVLDTIRLLHSLGCWVELTTLLIPEENDSPDELQDMARFIASLAKEIPWHLTAFYPTYKMAEKMPTPLAVMQLAAEIGRAEGLNYIYLGNRFHAGGMDTRCPGCGDVVIRRKGFFVLHMTLDNGICPQCGTILSGVWE